MSPTASRSEDIHDEIACIYWVLFLSDFDEVEMVEAITAIHDRLCEDQLLYLELWSHLDAPTRRQWKAWLTYDYDGSGRESGVFPERFR